MKDDILPWSKVLFVVDISHFQWLWLWMLTVITLLYDRFIKQLSICSFIHTPDVHQLFIFCDQPWCRLFKNKWFLSCLIILCERLFNKCCVIWVMFMQQKTWLMRKFFLSLVSRLYRRWFWNIYVHHCDWSSRAGTLYVGAWLTWLCCSVKY